MTLDELQYINWRTNLNKVIYCPVLVPCHYLLQKEIIHHQDEKTLSLKEVILLARTYLFDRKYYFMTGNIFPLQKSFAFTGNYFVCRKLFHCQESISFDRNHFLYQENLSSDRGHVCFQETITFDRKPFLLKGNNFVWNHSLWL